MKRRQFIRQTALTAIAIPYIHRHLTPDEVILGHNSHRYQLDRHWGDLNPSVIPVKDCHEMIQDKQGRIFLLTNETRNNVIIYDKDGGLIKTWGTTYPGAHGLTLSEEGGESFLYICDNARHEVIKTTLDGKEIMVLPYPAESGKYESADKYIPTETTIAIYELGFSDRVIAQDLAASLNLTATQKKDLVKALKKDRDGARAVMEKYPNYFQERMNELLQ